MPESLFLKHLYGLGFKNYSEVDVDLNPYVNCFTGMNGSGKTNFLDAVYYLSFCKSYFHAADIHNINFEESFFALKGTFEKDGKKDEIYCAVKKGQKKKFQKNKKDYEKLADHIGQYPVVIISPYDTDMIKEGSDTRRKFIDTIISQFDKKYLNEVIRYNKILKQRNALLKQFAEARMFDDESIEVWDQQLIPLGEVIHEKRQDFVKAFIQTFQKHYEDLSDQKEEVGIEYISQLEDTDFKTLLQQSKRKDEAMQYTTQGIHKDDLVFTLRDQRIKKFGSQGQQKSFLIALRLAQFEYLTQLMGIKPILLLDDIFDKLDHKRVENLIHKVSTGIFGQVLVSDTDEERMKKVFGEIDPEKVKLFNVNNGRVRTQEEKSVDA